MLRLSLRLTLTVLLLLGGCDQSPTGRTQVTLIPEQQMTAIGERTFAELLQTQPLVTDKAVREEIACITRALVEALPPPRGEWSVAVFQDPSPNAFALPGGKIGVNSGLLEVARSPDQLAAVIAHEIAHVRADHGNERLTQQLAVQGGLLLVDLLAEDPGSLGHEVLRQALGIGAELGLLLPYSRTHEREADLLGLELMARAGFDPRESLGLWRNMAAAGGGQPLEFLSTHPTHDSRLEDLQAAMPAALALQAAALEDRPAPHCGR